MIKALSTIWSHLTILWVQIISWTKPLVLCPFLSHNTELWAPVQPVNYLIIFPFFLECHLPTAVLSTNQNACVLCILHYLLVCCSLYCLYVLSALILIFRWWAKTPTSVTSSTDSSRCRIQAVFKGYLASVTASLWDIDNHYLIHLKCLLHNDKLP